jgi:trimethylamine--corrinoid protein Co-methyltransferase
MRTGLIPYGSPELSLLCAATADVARYMGVPHFSTSGLSDTFVDDNQAALEGTISNLFCTLCGSEMTHNVGSLEASKTGSLRYLVLMDSVIGYVKRVLSGPATRPSLLEPPGSDSGSFNSFPAVFDTGGVADTSLPYPPLSDRGASAAGGVMGHHRSMLDRAQLRLDWILENHRPSTLAPEVQSEIDDIVTAAEGRYA